MYYSDRTGEAARIRACSIGLALAATPSLWAQWTVISLHPVAELSSSIRAASDGQQVGSVGDWNDTRLVLWNNTPTFTVLAPNGIISGVGDGRQVGTVYQGGFLRAALWAGTEQSLVVLHPPGARDSSAMATDNGRHVGWASFGLVAEMHAVVWTGSDGSYVDLHPSGQVGSMAMAIEGNEQVGWCQTGTRSTACVWHGTADSYVNLHPTGAIESSAWGTDGSTQCGDVVYDPDLWTQAALWRGSMESLVILHPPGHLESYVRDCADGEQVGAIRFSRFDRSTATLWKGTASSRFDLHQLLPTGFAGSGASAIWNEGGRTWIAVTASFEQDLIQRHRAFLLVRDNHCVADLDDNGDVYDGARRDDAVTVDDLLFFLAAFAVGDVAADLDNGGDTAVGVRDGAVTIDDLLYFLARFEAGC